MTAVAKCLYMACLCPFAPSILAHDNCATRFRFESARMCVQYSIVCSAVWNFSNMASLVKCIALEVLCLVSFDVL